MKTRKIPRRPPTKQERAMMKQIQALPPVSERGARAIVDKVIVSFKLLDIIKMNDNQDFSTDYQQLLSKYKKLFYCENGKVFRHPISTEPNGNNVWFTQAEADKLRRMIDKGDGVK